VISLFASACPSIRQGTSRRDCPALAIKVVAYDQAQWFVPRHELSPLHTFKHHTPRGVPLQAVVANTMAESVFP
jgi:hypothetical protein